MEVPTLYLVLATLSLSLTYSEDTSTKLVRVKLEKFARVSFDEYRERVNKLQQALVNQPKTKRIMGYERIVNYLNLEYFGKVSLGSPPQQFNMLFDTGSANTWVFSAKCSKKNLSCQSHLRYNSSRSTTYRKNGRSVTLGYLIGSVKGFLSTDCLRVGNLRVKNVTFLEVVKEPQDAYIMTKFDGIFGLGLQALAIKGVPTVLSHMVNHHLISPMFSVYLSRSPGKHGGEIIFGGYDESKFVKNTLNILPVTMAAYWQIRMSRVTTSSGKSYCNLGCPAVIDTGTSYVVGPIKCIMDIISSLDVEVENIGGTFVVDCNNLDHLPTITFHINGASYDLLPQDYIIEFTGVKNQRACVIGMLGLTGNNSLWILGDVFLRTVYSIFNLEDLTVGLAKLVTDFDDTPKTYIRTQIKRKLYKEHGTPTILV